MTNLESAFPTGNQQSMDPESGMTLRDYFAAKALQSLLVAYPDHRHGRADIAVEAYRQADAMLEVRKETPA